MVKLSEMANTYRYTCLEGSDRFNEVIAKLPDSNVELLKIIATVLIIQTEGNEAILDDSPEP